MENWLCTVHPRPVLWLSDYCQLNPLDVNGNKSNASKIEITENSFMFADSDL